MVKLVIFSGTLLLLLFTTAVYAIGNIYLDGIGAFTQTTDAKNQFGGGGGLLYQISPDFNIFLKNIFSIRKIDHRTSVGKKYYDEYDYLLSIAGIEYLYNINNIPIFWKSAFGTGAGSASIKTGYNESLMQYMIMTDDTGLCFSLTTGIMFVFTQSISAFFDLGYHKTFFFNEFENAKIMGLQVNIGVRLTLFGKNKSIYSEY